MGIGIMVAIIVSAAIAGIGVEVMLIKSFFGDLKSKFTQTLIQDVAIRALSDKTGINVKSLIDNKPHPSDPSANEGNLLQKGANTIAAVGLKTLSTVGSLGEAGLKKGFNVIDEKNGKNISRAAKFYTTLGKEKAKHFVNQTKDDIKETADLYGDAFKQMVPEGVKKTVRGAKTKINDGKRWVNEKKKNIDDIRKNVSDAMQDTHFAKLSALGDEFLDKSLIKTRKKHSRIKPPSGKDALPVELRDPNHQIDQYVARSTQTFTNSVQQLNNQNNLNNNLGNLSDTERKDYMEKMNRYKQIAGSLKNQKDYAEYAKNAKEFAKASREINSKYFAGDKKGAELANMMLEDIVKRNPENLNSDTLVRRTLDFYTGYNSKTVRQSLDKVRKDKEKENQITGEEIGAEFGKLVGHSKGKSDIAKRLNEAAEEFGNPKEFREKIFNDIAAEMRGESTGNKAITYLGKENADKIKEKLESKHVANVEAAVDKARIEISKNYRTEGKSNMEALKQVESLENGAFDRDAYKKALEETIKSINSDNARNSNGNISESRVIENVQNVQNIQNIQSIEANTTGSSINQSEPQVVQPTAQVVQQTAQVVQPTAQVEQTTAQVEQPTAQVVQQTAQVVQPTAQVEQTTTQVAQSESQGNNTQVESSNHSAITNATVIKNVTEVKTTGSNSNQESISPETLQRISFESAVRATQPFQDTVSDLKKLFGAISGGDSPEIAGRKINEAITNITSGRNTEVTESMRELFSKVGYGNPKLGAETLGKTLNRLNTTNIDYDSLADSIAEDMFIANEGTSQTTKNSGTRKSTKSGKSSRRSTARSRTAVPKNTNVKPFKIPNQTDGTHDDAA